MALTRGFWIQLLFVINVIADVTILRSVTYLYETSSASPKLRIRGTGFESVDEHDVILEIGPSGSESGRGLRPVQRPRWRGNHPHAAICAEVSFVVSFITLCGISSPPSAAFLTPCPTLPPTKPTLRWANLVDRRPPVALILSKVTFASKSDKNLLPEPVIVAQVLNTPTVNENLDSIYTSATNELRVSGTGFMGAKKVDFYFNPPLYKEVGYEVVSKFPLAREEVVLRLRHGYKWRQEPGLLAIVGVDTGGGPVKINGEDGVRVALVRADLKVETTSDTQVIFADQSEILIKGEGFNPLGNTLRWANGLLAKGINYTTVETTESSIKLRLNSPGSHWLDARSVPGYLTLLAVNTGAGFVTVGPTNTALGVGARVAWVSAFTGSPKWVPSNPTPPTLPSQRPVVFPVNPTPLPSLQRPADFRAASTPKPSSRPTGPPSPQISSSPQHNIVLTISSSTIDVFVAGAIFGAAIVLVALYLFQRFISPSGAHVYSPLSTSTRDGVELAALNNNEPSHSSRSGVGM